MAFPIRSIRHRFILLIILVAVPLAVFDIYKASQERQKRTIEITNHLARSSDAVIGKISDLIDASHELLTGLAATEEVSSGNVEACSRLLHDIASHYAKYTNFSVVNRDKYLVCSSGPLAKPIYVPNSPNIDSAFSTGAFAVNPFGSGVPAGRPILVSSEPILDRKNLVVGTIYDSLSLDWIGSYFASVVLEGEHIVMFDGKGTVLASYPEDNHPVGSTIDTTDLSRLVVEIENGTGTFSHENGQNMIAAFATIPRIPGGAHIVAFTPRDVVQNEILASLYQRLMALGFYVAGSLFLGWVGARLLLVNPIDRLVASAEALAKGNLKVRSDVANDAGELGRLALAFDQMADALDTRTEATTQAELALQESETKLRSIFNSSNVTAIVSIDDGGNLATWNPGAERAFGFKEEEILGQAVTLLMPERYRYTHVAALWRATRTGEYHIIGKTVELTGLHKDGHEFPIEMSLGVWEAKGRKYFSAIINDITERKQAEKKIHQLAYTDHFTGMPNELLFLGRLNEIIHQNRKGFVASIELSDIGDIIGTFGLKASEFIIYESGKRLANQINDGSVAARVGPRLFKIAYVTDESTPDVIADIARRIFQIAQDPFHLMGGEVYVNVFMGVSVIEPGKSTAKSILTDVEIAHHEAEKSAASSIIFYSDAIKESLVRNTQIVSWLHSAIANNEFELFFQPQIDLQTNTVIGCEALIRWTLTSGERISPDEFIPIAEKADQIGAITAWTIEDACRVAAFWIAEHGVKLKIGVNISAEELISSDFVGHVSQYIKKAKIPAELLEFEITETALMKDVVMAARNLNLLRDMGSTIAIDDFGTGQASLAYLKNFPIDRLKIDQAFVKNLTTDKTDRGIVMSIIDLAHSLGISVIAEGAEEQEHIDLLVSLGCDEVQGFHIAKPMPASEFIKFTKTYS